ncbi:MAG: phosphoribosylformylglycinamidine synthase subunit PurQ [Oligoflexales bacterium]|nr:phosphoribosylformylglycinamidine synthase subunit PurQ [Oligoflexales bacterium]
MTTHASLPKAKIGILTFPGSNCEPDCEWVFKKYFNIDITPIWHHERSFSNLQALIIPGGFSFGDYLRGGHLASVSPCMEAVREFANKGGPILGICNGFQILTESKLLPGILLPNLSKRFVCKPVDLRVSSDGSNIYQSLLGKESTLSLPIAHGEGRYYIDDVGLRQIRDQGQIVFKYCDNPNGSVDDIAGICSENGKVLGLMPHPERACDPLLKGADGIRVFEAFLANFL